MKRHNTDRPNPATLSILLGFDFGLKRIGVAVGQTITKTARPLTTLAAQQGIPHCEQLTKLLQMWLPSALVVGIPLNMDGSEQALTHLTRAFVQQLEQKAHLPIFTMDERLTTKAARERLFAEGGFKALQGGQVDQVAAQLILQNWFNVYLPL